ncbi:MAG: PAS domain-containing protein [Deltaproteobacteria bacterium]|nr:PAS domain-containing protein [Deltaproteobacteria bacterium]
MTREPVQIEQIIESVLRGAAKMVGCHSASLIAFNEPAREVRIRVGATAGPMKEDLSRVEEVLGDIKSAVFPFDVVEGSRIFECWRGRKVFESGSIAELVGTAISAPVVASMDEIIGAHRFICVPAIGGQGRCHGVIVFEHPGPHHFNPQQRELLLAYAHRIGEILEEGARAWQPPGAVSRVLVDAEQRVVGAAGNGHGGGEGAKAVPREVLERAAALLASGEHGPVFVDPPVGAEVVRVRVRGEDLALVTVFDPRPGSTAAGRQLLQLAMSESAPAVLVDPGLRITSCNEAAGRLFGYGARELLDQPIATLFRDAREVRVILNHQLLFLTSGYFEEGTVLRRKDGTLFPGRIEALLLADDAGRVVGFLVLVRDRGAPAGDGAEEADRLMRRERLATMGEMAAQLAHEIRNPLVAIGATLESVVGSLPEGSETREVLGDLQGEITRLDMALRDYLSMAARHRSTVAPVDVGAVIDDARGLLDASRRRARASVRSTVRPGIVVLADADALRHVFFNLMLNALEAMPGGGEVRCSASVGRHAVTLHVDDRGGGLSGPQDECFEPFFTTKKHGTGLGLTVCRQVVETHGGAITLRNRRGGGCRASVVLPRTLVQPPSCRGPGCIPPGCVAAPRTSVNVGHDYASVGSGTPLLAGRAPPEPRDGRVPAQRPRRAG